MLVISCTHIFFASHGDVCTFLSLSFMKYNVVKTLCDEVIIFFQELLFTWHIFSCGFVSLKVNNGEHKGPSRVHRISRKRVNFRNSYENKLIVNFDTSKLFSVAPANQLEGCYLSIN